ncbi:MAG: hypothetical protein ACFCU4_01575 [Puniceicoccaceae bacterium]
MFARQPLLILTVLLLAGGCASYTTETAAMRQYWRAGDTTAAARAASGLAEKHGPDRDRILLRLEQGAALRADGQFAASSAVFENINATFSRDDFGPDLRISSLGSGIVSNPAQIPYTGRAYDRIFAAAFNALNYLALGDAPAARVALNNSYFWEQRAVQENRKQIEAATAQLNAADQPGAEKALQQPEIQGIYDTRLKHLEPYRVYAPYVNPFSVWLDGLFFLNLGADASDLERARKSFERLSDMVPKNKAVRQDFERASKARGPSEKPLVYVVFETGSAPIRVAEIIDIPFFLFSDSVPYFGIALPTLSFNSSYRPYLTLRTAEGTFQTELLADVDSIIATEFSDSYPVIFTRALISGLAKAALQYGIQKSVSDQSEAVKSLVLLSGLFYQYSMNQADLRSWSTLPKQIQIASFPRPDDNLMFIEDTFGSPIRLQLEPSRHHLVYIQAPSRDAPLNIHQFPLVR